MFAVPTTDNNGQPLTIREAEEINDRILRDFVAASAMAVLVTQGSTYENDARTAFAAANAFMGERALRDR